MVHFMDKVDGKRLTGMDRTKTIYSVGESYRIDHSGRYALYFRYLKMNTQVADDRRDRDFAPFTRRFSCV